MNGRNAIAVDVRRRLLNAIPHIARLTHATFCYFILTLSNAMQQKKLPNEDDADRMLNSFFESKREAFTLPASEIYEKSGK